MADGKNVLVIGLDPTLIDFSKPGYAPGMDATKVVAGLRSCVHEHAPRARICFNTLPGDTAAAVRRWL